MSLLRSAPGTSGAGSGCGLGDGAAYLPRLLARYGVDYSSEVIQEAQKRTVAKNVTFMVSDVRALRLPDAHFDLVSAFEIIEHLAEPKEFLEEIVRVLKPVGRLRSLLLIILRRLPPRFI